MAAYARVSGKTKTEAQIDFLNTLRIYCPFYGSSFFEVHCQYDDDPLNPQSSPPVLSMTAAIGPLALFLVSQTDHPTIIRHPYSRVMKWLCRAEKHIFTYWVIKKDVTLSRLEEMLQENGDAFDARPYCDCVYLVTPQSLELEHLVASYVKCRKEIAPCLPDAPIELQNPPKIAAVKHTQEPLVDQTDPPSTSATASSMPQPLLERRASSFGAFLHVLGAAPNDTAQTTSSSSVTNSLVGSGMIDADSSGAATVYGDDASGVVSSVFQSMFQSSAGSTEAMDQLPSAVQYASSMSELQKIASQTNFSDDEDMNDDDDDDDDDDYDTTKKRRSQRSNRESKKQPTSATNSLPIPSTPSDLPNASSSNGSISPEKSSGVKKSVNFRSRGISPGDDNASRSEEEAVLRDQSPIDASPASMGGKRSIRKSISNMLTMGFLKNKSNTTSSVSSSSKHSDSEEEADSVDGRSDDND